MVAPATVYREIRFATSEQLRPTFRDCAQNRSFSRIERCKFHGDDISAQYPASGATGYLHSSLVDVCRKGAKRKYVLCGWQKVHRGNEVF